VGCYSRFYRRRCYNNSEFSPSNLAVFSKIAIGCSFATMCGNSSFIKYYLKGLERDRDKTLSVISWELLTRVLCRTMKRATFLYVQLQSLKVFERKERNFEETPFHKVFTRACMQVGNNCILRLLFPSCPQACNWFFEMIHDYTAGIPVHVVCVVRELTSLGTPSKEFSKLSRDETKKTMEKNTFGSISYCNAV
jgi:hypothetical protein